MVVIKLRPAGEGPERDLLLDVDDKGGIGSVLSFDSAPDGRSDDFARLVVDIRETQLFTLSGFAQMTQT